MLIGLQLPQVIERPRSGHGDSRRRLAIVFVALIVLVRFVWVFGANVLAAPAESERSTVKIAFLGNRLR